MSLSISKSLVSSAEFSSTRMCARLVALVVLTACAEPLVYLESDGVVPIPLADVTRIQASNVAGNLRIDATSAKLENISVRYHVRAGGRTAADAEACIRNIQIDHDLGATGLLHLGWRFAGMKKPEWEATVDLSIETPASLAIETTTDSGQIDLRGLAAAARAESKSGDIRLETSSTVLATTNTGNITIHGGSGIEARSRAGRIRLRSSPKEFDLASESGGVTVELHCDETVQGSIVTQSGPVMLRFGGKAPVEIEATATEAAPMHASGDFDDIQDTQGHPLWLRRGLSGDKIRITTRSGNVHVEGGDRS